MQLVPFTSDYDQEFTTTLDGVQYDIACRWNERGQIWTFDLTRTADQEVLLSGASLLSGQDVLAPYALGIGGMIVTDLSNNATDPGPDDLGDRGAVIFLTEDELAILAAAGFPGIVSSAQSAPTAASGQSSTVAPVPGTPATPSSGGTSGSTTINNQTITINNQVVAITSIAGGFAGGYPFTDPSAVETLAYQFAYNAGANPGATLQLVALLMTTGGAGTVRFYMGGTFGTPGDTGTPSGTLVGSVSPAASGTATAAASVVGTPMTNPGGLIPIKVTVQSALSSAPLTVQPHMQGAVA